MQNLDVLCPKDLFFSSTLLRVLKQGIGSSVSLALMIVNLKLVMRMLLGPADLSGAQTLCVHKPAEVVVVDEYDYLMLGSF